MWLLLWLLLCAKSPTNKVALWHLFLLSYFCRCWWLRSVVAALCVCVCLAACVLLTVWAASGLVFVIAELVVGFVCVHATPASRAAPLGGMVVVLERRTCLKSDSFTGRTQQHIQRHLCLSTCLVPACGMQ